MVEGTSAGSLIGANSTRNAPSLKSSRRSAATWRLESGLASAARPGERHEPRVALEQRADLGPFALATEQGGRVGW